MTTRRPANDGNLWTIAELRTLKRLAKDRTCMAAAEALGRTPAAVQQKALRSGISFRLSHAAASRHRTHLRLVHRRRSRGIASATGG